MGSGGGNLWKTGAASTCNPFDKPHLVGIRVSLIHLGLGLPANMADPGKYKTVGLGDLDMKQLSGCHTMTSGCLHNT